jgi:hypothetical protein
MTTKERPILFSGPMVRAIIEGRKTQTRRIVKLKCHDGFEVGQNYEGEHWPVRGGDRMPCPYGKTGDRLRISEEVTVKPLCEDWFTVLYHADRALVERPCDPGLMQRIKNYKTGHLRGVSLPPAYARPDRLIITGVRVERLQDISNEDCVAEGMTAIGKGVRMPDGRYAQAGRYETKASTVRQLYSELWESINGPGSWGVNPWVWVIEFRRCEQ